MQSSLTLHEFLRVVRRRRWLIIAMAVLVPLVVGVLSLSQPKLYQATARVLLSQQNLGNQLSGVPNALLGQQPDRGARTQAGVAQTTAVARRALARVPGTGLTPGGLLATSSVAPNPNADVLIFTVDSRSQKLARRLVNAYANAYKTYRRELDAAPIVVARANIESALKRLGASSRNAKLRATLADRDQTLATMQALQTSNASVIQTAGGAAQIEPRPKRNVTLAVLVGLILGLGLAFLWETLDTRVRDSADIAHLLGAPLLARVPAPSKDLQTEDRLIMNDDPDGTEAEPFRVLRTNLDFVMLDSDIRTIMVTSAVEGEGKSTTISNLALTLARSGLRVVLVDLDLRAPSLDRLFVLRGVGLTQVALGSAPLDDALVRLAIPESRLQAGRSHRLPEYGDAALTLLPAGAIPPDRAMFLDSQALNSILQTLREQFDLVLIDAPPSLPVGDALTLSRRVDGIFVVARLNVVRRSQLHELARLLAMTPARVLGFVATGGQTDPGYGYGYGYEAYPARPDDSGRGSAKVGRVA